MSDNQDVPDWVRSIPDSWRLFPVGKLFDERKEYVSDTEFPALSVTKRGVIPQLSDVAKTQNGDSRKLVRSGDFVINSRSDRKGSSGISEQDGSVSVVYTVLRPREELDLNFVHHLLRSSAFQEEFYRWGSGIVADLWSTRYSAMKKIMLPTPPLDEQRAIADYLDRETQKIDELIDEQRGLIETLRERRQAVIDDVFLRRATGSRRLRRLLTSSITGPFGTQLKASEYVNDCVPVVNPTHIVDSRIRPDRSITVTNEKSVELERFRIFPGDVILGRKGDVDKAAVVSEVEEGYICGSDSMALRPSGEVNGEYLWWYLQSPSAHRQLEQWSVGSTVAGLNQRTISHLEIPTMDLSGQLEICAYLNAQTSRIDELISESEDLIALSQERRAALITAAVTGQIDVRTTA
ncbi:restriction endonuclease subunit S [Corynebacterium variabile]|uniref:restriction endonuclease subunit S n=1 Tax=Corynebacterium variabile TaxID=1727 RepID=UPI003A95D1BC